MKSGMKYMWIVPVIVGIFFLCRPSCAQDPALEQIGNFGTIDWVGQKVAARGIGAPPEKYYGKPQARPMAQRAAIMDARRNLLEVIKGVHIDSTTTVVDYVARDDTIVSSVKGELKLSSVDDIRYLSDGRVEASVSIPLTGHLGEILMQLAVRSPETPVEALPMPEVEKRIRNLEDRVKALEDKLTGLKRLTSDQKETIILFRQFVNAWMDYMANSPSLIQAGYVSDRELSPLNKKLKEQEARLAELSARLEEMAGRLSALEASGIKSLPKAGVAGHRSSLPSYTGLVIDARRTGFRPCLKPKVFGRGNLLYPGEYVDLQKAVRNGYVRYYRKIGPAQQSTRAGSLPYTVKAKGTWRGRRNLGIGAEEYNSLKALTKAPGNFLTDCKVVIVF